jgi:hypothetical protein
MFGRMGTNVLSIPKEPGGTVRDDEIHFVRYTPVFSLAWLKLGSLEHAIRHPVGRSETLWRRRAWDVLQPVRKSDDIIWSGELTELLFLVNLAPRHQSFLLEDPSLLTLRPPVRRPLNWESTVRSSIFLHLTPLMPSCSDWADHGICGRGILLDLVRYYESTSGALPYDPWTTHGITVAELQSCAKAQKIEFRHADILIIRMGFMKKFNESTREDRVALGEKPETLFVMLLL